MTDSEISYWRSYIRPLAIKRSINEDDIEDITQDCLIAMLDNPAQSNNYYRRIIDGKIADHFKYALIRRHECLDDYLYLAAEQPEPIETDVLEIVSLVEIAYQDELTIEQRQALQVCNSIQGWNQKAALDLGITRTALYCRRNRAVKQLREYVIDRLDAPNR